MEEKIEVQVIDQPDTDFWATLLGTSPAVQTTTTKKEEPKPEESVRSERLLSANEVLDIALGITPLEEPKREETQTPPVTQTGAQQEESTTEETTPPTNTATNSVSDEEMDAYTSQVFKHHAKKLIQKGIWADIEGFEEMQLDDKGFEELMTAQFQHKVNQEIEGYKSQNDILKTIMDYVEEGGNPDLVLDLFKERQAVQQINTSTLDGKKELIKQYYQDVLDYPASEIARRMKKLDIEGESEVDAEFAIAEQKYTSYFKQKEGALLEEQKQAKLQEERQRKAKLDSTVDILKTLGYQERTAKAFSDKLYTYKYKTKDGDLLTEFDVKLLELQRDPKKYIDLAEFVLDPKAYIQRQTQKAKNEVTEKNFEVLKWKPTTPTNITTVNKPAQTTPNSEIDNSYKNLIKQL